jgi:dTDP-4-amino-4,6-dideoxygalactose transaminase
MTITVPSFDLTRARERIQPELDRRLRQVLSRNAFVGGPEVAELETAFARYLEAAGCVAVANGTDALVLALRALELGPGAQVIVPAFTFVATAAAVVLAGGVPVFADVDAATYNLDVEDAARRVTGRTAGIIGVHLFGLPCDLAGLSALCQRHRLWLVEDAAQAHGARWNGRRVGTVGDLATWSFYPSKNLGAFGDAGAVTGMDEALLARVRRLANHGRSAAYRHEEVGTNSRLDGFQAAVLNSRLPHLEEDNRRRREIAARYRAGLGAVPGLALPVEPPGFEPVYHQFTVRTEHRDELQSHLAERGIGTVVFYPIPLHQQPAFAEGAAGEALPVAERAAREVLSLPMFPELTDGEVDQVVVAVGSFFGVS